MASIARKKGVEGGELSSEMETLQEDDFDELFDGLESTSG